MASMGSVPLPVTRTTQGKIHSAPGIITSLAITPGSTAGTYTFRDGRSAAGIIRLVFQTPATTPSQRGTTIIPDLGEGLLFRSAAGFFLHKTNGNKATISIAIRKYRP